MITHYFKTHTHKNVFVGISVCMVFFNIPDMNEACRYVRHADDGAHSTPRITWLGVNPQPWLCCFSPQAIFEVISSEHSYLHSLEILIRMFKNSAELSEAMTKTEHHHLFSNISDVCEASKKYAYFL